MKRADALAAALAVLACYREPSVVFVSDSAYRETIEIATGLGAEPTIRVGEPLVLRVRRTSGPWHRVDRTTVEPAHCWWGVPPDPVEPEVADNVTWRAQPEGAATFNVAYREDRTREVRFSAPGVYSLTAESDLACATQPAVDTLTVRVVVG